MVLNYELSYADDILIYKPINTPIDFDNLQADINTIAHWISSNHLTVNSSKTKCMLISRRRSQAHHLPPLYLNGSVIQPVEHYKYLGVWISSDLTWSKHVESISCKARRLLGFMFRTFSPFCKPEAIITLYKSQVLPVVDYACVVWDPHLKRDQYLLESVQTFALRMASRSWRVNAEELNSQFQLPTLTSRRSYFKLLMTFKFLNDLLYCPQIFLFLMPPPILEFSILVNLLYLLPEQQLILTHFLLVLLDCGTVYQQIMYIMTLLDNLKGVFKILSYAFKLLHLSCPFLLFIL